MRGKIEKLGATKKSPNGKSPNTNCSIVKKPLHTAKKLEK